jgi:hypothetical protein
MKRENVIDDIVEIFVAERSPPIEEVIQSGVVPRFVEFLVREDFPQLQVCYSVRHFFFCADRYLSVIFVFLFIYLVAFSWLLCSLRLLGPLQTLRLELQRTQRW